MSHLALYLLGPPRVELDGEPVHIGRSKAVALLVYLAVEARRHSRDALATLLWPEFDQRAARAELRRALAVLNRSLEKGWLAADRETIGLDPDADPSTGSGQVLWLDMDQFCQHLAACEAHGHPATEACPDCLARLTEAAEGLYRDDFMAGFTLPDSPTFDEWQRFQTQGLRDELASALERLAACHSAEREWDAAIACARRWLELDPTHEPAHRRLMALYSEAGRRSAALRQYRACVRVLEEELGVPPSAETTALYERLLAGAETERERETPTLPSHNLLSQPTPFVGREAELAHIARRLDDPDCRLLTLVGPGGIGKTRLALQAAQALIQAPHDRPRFPHGVFFVSLVGVESPDSLVPTIASALNFSFYRGGDPKEQLLDFLRDKRLLLILDNFEQLLSSPPLSPPQGGRKGGPDLLPQILAAAPEVKLLVTSREALNLQQEWFHPVQGMACPLPDAAVGDEPALSVEEFDAVALFVQCARRARPGFSLGEEARPVTRICQLVEGTPLAIELAAAWSRAMPLAQIATELERGFDILTTSLRDVPSRHRSMRAVFDHSWHLLSARERELMQALSVFRGGFQAEAAVAVARASLPTLAGLVERSLLRVTPDGRYHMHELLRQYAAEQLHEDRQEEQLARDRHSEYYAASLRQQGETLKGHGQQAALAEMEAEIENARAAWNWAVEREQVQWLQQAVDGLCRFYEWRGRYLEGEEACRTAVNKLEAGRGGAETIERLRLLARTLTWQGIFNWMLGNTERANQMLGHSLTLLDGPELANQDTRLERAFILLQMGSCQLDSDPPVAKRLYEQSLNIYRKLGDRWEIANVLFLLGEAGWFFDFNEMNRLHEESLAMRETLGDHKGVADSLAALGRNVQLQWQLEKGAHLLRESVAIRGEIGDRAGLANGLLISAWIMSMLGKFEEARLAAEESLAIYRDLGNRDGLSVANAALGGYELWLGWYRQARPNIERGLTLAREIGNRKRVGEALWVLGQVALAEEAWTEALQFLQESIAVSRMLGHQHYLSWALASAAYVARGLDNVSRAVRYLSEALQIAMELRCRLTLIMALPAIALLLADEGQEERAVELYALAARYPYVANSRWFEDVAGKHIAAVAATLPLEAVAAAQERGRARDLEATVAELLAELKGA